MPEPNRKRSRRAFWLLALAAAILVLAVLGFGRSEKKSDLKFDTGAVDRGRIAARVTATGTLSPLVQVQVGSQVSGRIQALFADFNSTVKKGEVIARLDPQLFEAAVRQSSANLSAAEANLARSQALAEDARLKYERAKTSEIQKLISESDLETARATADSANASVVASRSEVEQARASLHQAQINLAYTTIVSPTDGTVISRSVDVGQTVAASLSAPTLFTIAEDLRKMQVDTSVAEADVGKLQAGMEASFFVDAFPSERFKGRVRQIRNAPQTVQNVVTYDAVLDVDNPDLKLKPGMTANVTFLVAEREGVLRVPNAALRFRPPPEMLGGGKGGGAAAAGGASGGEAAGGAARGGGGRSGGRGAWRGGGAGGAGGPGGAGGETPDRKSVWVMRGDKPTPVSIRAGVSDGSLTEVVEGELREGDRVIIGASGGSSNPAGAGGGGPGSFRRIF
ncbi:MAG TPA: efflux RND transporter periplasmic adaptor subunit [Candidatus Polarisedimenticolia bacterium]|nr:efflux RND transporter periplasmic adaptor subunit [Candidatus Polarisedimenticolia bacterium]